MEEHERNRSVTICFGRRLEHEHTGHRRPEHGGGGGLGLIQTCSISNDKNTMRNENKM